MTDYNKLDEGEIFCTANADHNSLMGGICSQRTSEGKCKLAMGSCMLQKKHVGFGLLIKQRAMMDGLEGLEDTIKADPQQIVDDLFDKEIAPEIIHKVVMATIQTNYEESLDLLSQAVEIIEEFITNQAIAKAKELKEQWELEP